jgi:hypothetical protein
MLSFSQRHEGIAPLQSIDPNHPQNVPVRDCIVHKANPEQFLSDDRGPQQNGRALSLAPSSGRSHSSRIALPTAVDIVQPTNCADTSTCGRVALAFDPPTFTSCTTTVFHRVNQRG